MSLSCMARRCVRLKIQISIRWLGPCAPLYRTSPHIFVHISVHMSYYYEPCEPNCLCTVCKSTRARSAYFDFTPAHSDWPAPSAALLSAPHDSELRREHFNAVERARQNRYSDPRRRAVWVRASEEHRSWRTHVGNHSIYCKCRNCRRRQAIVDLIESEGKRQTSTCGLYSLHMYARFVYA